MFTLFTALAIAVTTHGGTAAACIGGAIAGAYLAKKLKR